MGTNKISKTNSEGFCFNVTDSALYELNARTQITLWGEKHSMLHDYAFHLWQGLVGEFYYGRWKIWFDALKSSLKLGEKSHQAIQKVERAILTWEEQWTRSRNNTQFYTHPKGNSFRIS